MVAAAAMSWHGTTIYHGRVRGSAASSFVSLYFRACCCCFCSFGLISVFLTLVDLGVFCTYILPNGRRSRNHATLEVTFVSLQRVLNFRLVVLDPILFDVFLCVCLGELPPSYTRSVSQLLLLLSFFFLVWTGFNSRGVGRCGYVVSGEGEA